MTPCRTESRRFPAPQRGSLLLEALIAILLFAFGVLGLVGLLGSSVRVTNDARYRAEASNLANALISEMWTNTTSTTQWNDYATGGSRLLPWETKAAALLPYAGGNRIAVDTSQPGLSPESRTVVVTVSWQLPGETEAHRFLTTAEVGKNFQPGTWP